MFSLTILGLVAAYMAVLFAVAWRGEQKTGARNRLGPWAYPLSLSIYCTSWTYYGAVGTAARDGWEYLPIYMGPVIGLTLLFPLWRRIAAAARRENVGSMADFVASRYGKSQTLGAAVTVVIGENELETGTAVVAGTMWTRSGFCVARISAIHSA